LGAGGNVGYVAAAAALAESPWSGVALRGSGPLWLGPRRNFAVMQAVKAALDPDNRFPSLED
jgi:FAD/FMN-containing dehydrogenase